MSVTVAVQDKYVRLLKPLGDLQQAVDVALQRYAIEQIAAKIAELRKRDQAFQAKYGCDYEAFIQRTASDEQFVAHIEQAISKTWELDLAEWEFCHKGAEDWAKHLQAILLE
ncbi:MAG TPA: hypothetical protein EYP55_09475 [Anaerolineae bacterium]|nr:hypothetical protein [Anaerolineae bacterium]